MLVKLVLDEPGSSEMIGLWSSITVLVSAGIAYAELRAALRPPTVIAAFPDCVWQRPSAS